MRYLVLFFAAAFALSADTFTFDIVPNALSTVQQDVTGTVTLAANCDPCAATSIVFTSVPAGLDITGDATTWANQVVNSFWVVNGAITQFQFFAIGPAAGGSTKILCESNTLSVPTFNGFVCPTNTMAVEQWEPTTTNQIVEDLTSGFGITFGPQIPQPSPTGTPEPGMITGMTLGFACLWMVWSRDAKNKKPASRKDQRA